MGQENITIDDDDENNHKNIHCIDNDCKNNDKYENMKNMENMEQDDSGDGDEIKQYFVNKLVAINARRDSFIKEKPCEKHMESQLENYIEAIEFTLHKSG